MNTLSIWPILVSTVVAFGLSSLWYSPILFGKEWLEMSKLDENKTAKLASGGMTGRYIAQLVFTLVMFAVLAFGVSNLAVGGAVDGAFLGLLAWLGLTVPVSLSSYLWKGFPFKLFLIETVDYLVILAVGGAIIGAWR